MPPREKVSKEQVLNTAFEMTREDGFGDLTARKLAQRLGSSTQPIFRAYDNMEMLRRDLFFKSVEFFSDYMIKKKGQTTPIYLSMGMAYIELARKEKYLFELLTSIDDYGEEAALSNLLKDEQEEILNRLPDADVLEMEQKRELLLMISLFIHGMATLLTSGRVTMSDKEVRLLLTKAYDGFLKSITDISDS